MGSVTLSSKQVREFRKEVYSFYEKEGRHSLPWRKEYDPYAVMVSEIMLQQTQVDRVIPKFTNFIARFRNVHELARASTREVLQAWQGLGYNRRALLLQRAARDIVVRHEGAVPKTQQELVALPGIGEYTANAIRAFAFNEPVVVIETNIRGVYLHHFFKKSKKVSDKKILPLIEQSVDRLYPRKWYSALMDYGSHLKSTLPNPSRKSMHHTKQSSFKGSDREIRGKIVRFVVLAPRTKKELSALINDPKKRVPKILAALKKEGFIEVRKEKVFLKG